MSRFLFSLIALAIPFATLAEGLIQQSWHCPIGGERFNVAILELCTETDQRRMSLARVGTCEQSEQLPQCPSNFLPIYKNFSDQDIASIQEFMQFETYESSVDQSRYYLAYLIEQYIRGPEQNMGFSLLLTGLWRDPENTWNDPVYMDLFTYEAIGEMNRIDATELPFLQALLAFAYVKAEQLNNARPLLEAAKQTRHAPEVLQAYIRSIETCIADQNNAFCNPNTLIPTD